MSQHYEIMLMLRPDQSDQVPEMLKRYQAMIEKEGGVLHRMEDWGRRSLAYSIQIEKDYVKKAHYALLNIQAPLALLESLKEHFKFNDAVVRSLVNRTKDAITKPTGLHDKDKTEKVRYAKGDLSWIDYKQVAMLRRYILETGSIIPARISGTTATQQRRITHAVKLARYIGFLHYCSWHR